MRHSFLYLFIFICLIFYGKEGHGATSEKETDEIVPYKGKKVPARFIKNYFRRADLPTDGFDHQDPRFPVIFGPAQRPGGIGPWNTIEVSPWTRSTKFLCGIPEGTSLDFVYDLDNSTCYVDQLPLLRRRNRKSRASGHPSIKHVTKTKRALGGSIQRIKGNLFRTNESSGHFGVYWTDEWRFIFIENMSARGLRILHEPWVLDEEKKAHPEIWNKIQEFRPIEDTELSVCGFNALFPKLSIEDLQLYQDNFVRGFGNSLLNPSAFCGIFVALPAYDRRTIERYRNSPYYYEEDSGSKRPFFTLRKNYRNRNRLDMHFRSSKGEFYTVQDVQAALLSSFKNKYLETEEGVPEI